jgi:hypothetical protein
LFSHSAGLTTPPRKKVTMPTVHLLDYVAGNIRSLVNAIEKVGYTVEWVKSPEDVEKADVSHAGAICEIQTVPVLISIIETNSPRRWPFRSLPKPTILRWIPPRDTEARPGWQTIYGHMRWAPSTV